MQKLQIEYNDYVAFDGARQTVAKIMSMDDEGEAVMALVSLCGLKLISPLPYGISTPPGWGPNMYLVGRGLTCVVPNKMLTASLAEWQEYLAELLTGTYP